MIRRGGKKNIAYIDNMLLYLPFAILIGLLIYLTAGLLFAWRKNQKSNRIIGELERTIHQNSVSISSKEDELAHTKRQLAGKEQELQKMVTIKSHLFM
ncbi:MAG: hypothetical protein WD491_05360, partial [Balneolales bacterium]